MGNNESITRWLQELKEDSPSAARHLWEAYFQQMVNLARQRLPREKRQVADEEDVALSAFKSFCRGVQRGRFEQLINRESLWPLLMVITINKAKDQARFVFRQKRGGDISHEPLWEQVLSREPAPEFALQLSDQLERLLEALDSTGDDQIRSVVLWSLEGYTTGEIAGKLDCTKRTVQRKLKIVRRIWIEDDSK